MRQRLVRAFACPALVFAAVALAHAQDLALSSPDARRTLKAVETAEPPTIDGVLNEPLWQRAARATGFVQADPLEGEPATEQTEVRVAFDRNYL